MSNWYQCLSLFDFQTNLPVFRVKESSVRRRYSDFEWLRNELERDSKVWISTWFSVDFFTKIPSILDFMRFCLCLLESKNTTSERHLLFWFWCPSMLYSYSFWNNDNYDAVHFLKKPVFPLFFLLDLCFYLSFFGMCQKIGVKSFKNLLKRGKGYKKMFSFSTSFAHFRQIFNFGDHLFKTKLNSNFGFLIPRLWGRGNH